MSSAYGPFQIAGTVYPLTNPSSASALYAADKTLFFALDFFSFVITSTIGTRLVADADAIGIKQPGGSLIASAVQYASPVDPTPFFQQNVFGFPLLATWRLDESYTQKTAAWEEATANFQLLYVLPPLDAAQAERVMPLLRSVSKALNHKTTQSFDPAYTPPTGSLGQSPWDPPFANIDKIGFEKAEFGYLEGVGNQYFPCVRMRWYAWEKDVYLQTGAGALTGFDITGDLVAPDGTKIDPFVQSAVSATGPSITSLSVTTGTAAGGTSVTITGSGFVNGVGGTTNRLSVVFGSIPAASVTFTDSSHVTAVTPAMQGTGTVGVALSNPDGRMAVSPQQFTFT